MSKLTKALGLIGVLTLGGSALLSSPVRAIGESGCVVPGSTVYYSNAQHTTQVGECHTTCTGCECSGQITPFYRTFEYDILCTPPPPES